MSIYGLCDKFSPSSFVGDIGITLYVHIFFVRAAHSYTDTAETSHSCSIEPRVSHSAPDKN